VRERADKNALFVPVRVIVPDCGDAIEAAYVAIGPAREGASRYRGTKGEQKVSGTFSGEQKVSGTFSGGLDTFSFFTSCANTTLT